MILSSAKLSKEQQYLHTEEHNYKSENLPYNFKSILLKQRGLFQVFHPPSHTKSLFAQASGCSLLDFPWLQFVKEGWQSELV